MIELRNIRKSFDETPILRGIDLDIDDGEVVALIGPSGAGKSTLLRCLNFLERADEGTLRIGDVAVNLHHAKKADVAAVRKKSTMVFQSFNLFKNMTVLQNVAVPLVVNKRAQKEDARRIAHELLAKVGLDAKADEYPSRLSGGQQQRVGIARALALDPEVILFDEPTSALDPELVGEVLSVMKDIAGSGRTMIVVTHEMAFARDVANRVVFLADGEIVEQGTSAQMFSTPREERTRRFLSRFLEADYSI